jgi:hypothetical protein
MVSHKLSLFITYYCSEDRSCCHCLVHEVLNIISSNYYAYTILTLFVHSPNHEMHMAPDPDTRETIEARSHLQSPLFYPVLFAAVPFVRVHEMKTTTCYPGSFSNLVHSPSFVLTKNKCQNPALICLNPILKRVQE